MKTLFSAFLLTLLISTIAQADQCPIEDGDPCSFYLRCVEDEKPCGKKGYAISYGYRYCQEFTLLQFGSQQSADWRDATRECLKSEILRLDFSKPQMTCDRIKKFAFDSHPHCYIKPDYSHPELSICYLPKLDILRVANVVDTKDAIGKLGRKQIVEVAKVCLTRLLSIHASFKKETNEHESLTTLFESEAALVEQLQTWEELAKPQTHQNR